MRDPWTVPGIRRLLWERDRARYRARKAARAAVGAAARRVDLGLAPTDFTSPVPAVPPPEDPAWGRELPFEVDTDTQMAFVESKLAPYLSELPGGLAPAERLGFRLWNGQYQAGDAELLYALIRHLRPRRVLELGSGYSTLVSAAACAANARAGHRTELVAVDPRPRATVPKDMEGLTRIEMRDCRELPLDRFRELGASDILFIDTSHVVKLGSEVNWLVLEVLPRLATGVHVHFHDVFLPYEYPRYLFEQQAYFNEQYLLQAFLAGNADWEVTLAVCALYRAQRKRLSALVPSLAGESPDRRFSDVTPAAFWIRRR